MQGLIVTRDLLERGYSVALSDIYRTKVSKFLKKYPRRSFFEYVDLRDIDATTRFIKKRGASVVINCADMYWNGNVYNACLKAKAHCVDLGAWIEMTRDQLRLDSRFKKIGKTAITGCGSVPGIGNVMLNYAAKKFDTLNGVDVGFSWDSNMDKFVVPFSMKSILEEFTYDPRFIKSGKWVSVKPLKISMERHFRAIGKQKVFLVQHPELYTFYHYYKKQGLKNVRFFAGFPNHSLEKIYSLIDLGFHREKPVVVEGIKVSPLDLLNPVLKELSSPPGYTETENLWVDITGIKDGRKRHILMECIVPPIKGWESSGCNIDTGFPAAIMACMIKDGIIKERGSFAPEAIVPERPFFAELAKRGLMVYENRKRIN